MRSLFSIRSLLWPTLAATAFAAFFVVTQPGQLHADGYEYDAIARSILQGRYELREEFSAVPEPTMHREPGYPALRAFMIAAVGDYPAAMLWLQTLLCGAIVWIAARVVHRMDPRWELPIAWLTALYPGFSVWAGQHYSEVFATFLVGAVAYLWVRVWEQRDGADGIRLAALLGMAIGALTLTKASFQLLPLFAAAFLFAGDSLKKRWKQGCVLLVASALIIAPWVIRNQRQFGEAVITYRTGIVIYTRALKAQIPWEQVVISYGSVLVGEATMRKFFPQTPPMLIQLWDQTWIEKNALLQQGMRYYQADGVLFARGVQTIFSSPSIFARYVAWSPIDVLRFFELTSPLSPKFGVERIGHQEAHDGTLRTSQFAIVLMAHALQLVWWGLIATGFILLVRARLWRHPSLLLIGYAVLLYAPFDNIPRYAVPVLPWIVALIVVAMWRPTTPSTILSSHKRSSDRRLIEAANVAYHEAEAGLYDTAHPEIIWCERLYWERFARNFLGHQPRGDIRLLDIGAGTGFVGSAISASLRKGDTYVASDLSQEMLARLRATHASAPFAVETIVASADHLPFLGASFQIVVVNSALHHFPDVPAALREAARVLAPGGLFVVMHEPNIRFARSLFFRQVARAASVLASRIDAAAGPAKPDYTPVFAHVNRRLLEQGIITEVLTSKEIQALVDVHSPTARGRYEAVGFDPLAWCHDYFLGWKIERFETYNFLGKLDPSAQRWRRVCDRALHLLFPRSGSLFSLVIRKPQS